jgi:hypothetical protein
MKRLALVLALASALHAEPAAPPAPDALLANLTARDAKLRVVRLEKKPEKPVIGLFGNLADADPGGPAKAAQAFLEANGTLLGFPPDTKFPGNLQTLRDEKDEEGHTLVLVPAKNGVPYLSGALSFAFDVDGKLVGVSGRYRAVDGAQMGSMNAGEAAEKALKLLSEEVPGAYLSADGTVREYLAAGAGGTLRHVYEVSLPLGAKRTPRLILLGPGGEALHSRESGDSFDATGKVLVKHGDRTGKSATLTDLVDKADPKAPKSKRLWGKYYYPQSEAILYASSKDKKYDYPERLGGEFGLDLLFYDPRFLEVNVYYHLMKARKHAIDVAKVPKVDVGRALLFDVWQYPDAGNSLSQNNAYYDPASMSFHFAVWNPKMPRTPPLWETGAIDPSFIYHEYGHHVLNMATKDVGNAASTLEELYEIRAIGEGFSDYFSFTMTRHDYVGDVFADSIKREVGGATIDYCNVIKTIEFGKANDVKVSFHAMGRVFAQICRDFETIYGDRTLAVMVKALKNSSPRTFSNFRTAMDQFATRDQRGRNAERVFKLMMDRKMYECSYEEETPIPRQDAGAQAGGGI